MKSRGFDVPLFKNPITDGVAIQVAGGSCYFIKGTPVTILIDNNRILRNKAVGTAESIIAADIRNLI